MTEGKDDASPPEESLPPLELREPLPPVVETDDALAATVAAVARGTGPVALDAERASGYRYSARAYLVQLRRDGADTHLIDPIAFDDLHTLNDAIGDAEWILHAATQDLACLREIGLVPQRLFDTELAGRLLNLPRVGLASLVQQMLGHTLAKEHSAVDWSTRPLPEPWLEYAALDVEVLVELRDLMDARLTESGKREWATQEFESLLSFTGPRVREEPWRRTSGIHRARGRRQLGFVRALWETRDRLAADRDVTPGRVLPDSSILAIATAQPKTRQALRELPVMRNRSARRHIDELFYAIQDVIALDEGDLPTVSQQHDGPPPARAWSEKNPQAAARLGRCREAVGLIAEANDLPVENLLMPDTVRRLAWEPPADPTPEAVADQLYAHGARQWQVALCAEELSAAVTHAD